MDVLQQFRRYLTKPHVRPWAMLAPILVLVVCLPLLRPLRHPDPREVSNDELARLATVESLVERRTLAIDDATFLPTAGTFRRGESVYSEQPPALAVLLAGPYWIMQRFGLTFDNNPALVAYLLTLIGATIPVAMAAGLIYRMSRLFELPRRRRSLLAAVVVFGSGLVSYGVVLNAHAPAAALVLAAAAAIVHVAISRRPGVTSGWLAIAGLCAALAATIDPAAVVFLALFALTIPAMRWRWPLRFGGFALYALGVAPALLLHGALLQPITGDIFPPAWHRQFIVQAPPTGTPLAAAIISPSPTTDEADDPAAGESSWTVFGRNLARLAAALFGQHGIFSHFPVVLLGLFGVAAVMHRHWPTSTKLMAGGTVAGAIAIIVARCVVIPAGPGTMFGPQAFVLFLPLMLFWSGAWMRRPHGPIKWTLAACLLIFSIAVTLIGATDPYPRDGYDHYTAAEAMVKLMNPPPPTPYTAILAGR
jgi:MFS family permease